MVCKVYRISSKIVRSDLFCFLGLFATNWKRLVQKKIISLILFLKKYGVNFANHILYIL